MERGPTSQESGAGDPLASMEPWDLEADAYAADVLPMAEHFARDALQLAIRRK